MCSCGEKRREQPVAVDGILDLSYWDFEKDGIVDLNGEWRFVWGDFIEPVTMAGGFGHQEPSLFEIPGRLGCCCVAKWNNKCRMHKFLFNLTTLTQIPA